MAMDAHPPSGSGSGSGSSSAVYPRWVMLEQYLEIIKVQNSSSCSTTNDDAKTLATAHTSAGHVIQVSLRLADPPALSRVFLRIPDSLEEEKSKVLVAHGDSVLIQVRIKEKDQKYHICEHFVYNAGAAAAEPSPRPPSLWLVPPYYQRTYYSGSDLLPRELSEEATGLLHRSEDGELVVAELNTWSLNDDTPRRFEIFLFRYGEWKRYKFLIRKDWDLRYVWWDTVVSVDDRLLCWVDFSRCIMLLDVFKETPTVQYVRLPMDSGGGGGRLNWNVCATASGGLLKFVNIFSRCCCGAAASCDCKHSHHAYTIHTWTMRIGNGDMEWVKDGMIDCTELWALDGYKDLPCYPLDRPIVSLDEPEVICFRLRDTKYDSRTLWQIMVNMRSKTILSVSRLEEEVGSYCYVRDKLIPSKVSYFFNTYPSSGTTNDDAALTCQSEIDIKRSPSVAVDEQPNGEVDCSNPTLQQQFSSAEASEIFEAFQAIPSYGLGPDEVKAYRILSSDDGRRLKSLLRLPKDVRKDWLLMEIKASDAY